VTAHDFADPLDVRRAIAGKDVGDISKVARAQQTRADDCEETGVKVAAVTESVDHAPRYEECLARGQVGAPTADGKRVTPSNPKTVSSKSSWLCGAGMRALAGTSHSKTLTLPLDSSAST
jgi:hypothetical protein